ncbi:MAG: polysaccharide biosynthesis tyrosine autokinase [Candidatus Omnitrophica bacterium]|nr:polysaccharide biosynthesis tyrosine autokinase [Candidatus Omnitrophota bacterium]
MTLPTSQKESFSFRELFHLVLKYKRMAVTFFAVVVISTTFYSLLQPKIYIATTTALIEEGTAKITPFDDVFSVHTAERKYYQTQYELLKSRSVARLVMNHLNLWSEYRSRDPIATFLKSVEVEPVKESRLVRINVASRNPKQAADIANSIVRFYVEQKLEGKTVLSRQASEWLDDKLKEVREKLMKSEIQFEWVKLKNELVKLDEKYLPAHPKVVQVRSRIESLEKQFGSILSGLGSAKLDVLYNQLEREVDSNKKVYAQMLSRLKETIASEGIGETNVFVVDPAEVPTQHARPRVGRNMLLSMVIGFFGAIGLCMIFSSLDDAVKTADEVEQFSGLPVLGIVPEWNSQEKELVAERAQVSWEAEAFRGIRTGLLFSSPDKPHRTLLVTSPYSREGKTLVSSNLALTIAQSGARVLLVEADLRKPRLEKIFGTNGTKGLSNALVDSANVLEYVHRTPYENLFLLPCGSIPPTPSEFLSSRRMRELIELLKGQFDYMIVDAPPFMVVTDPVILGAFLDGVIIVVRYGVTPKDTLKRLKSRFQEVRANLLGVILNAINIKEERSYHRGLSYYSYSQMGDARELSQTSVPSGRPVR